MSTWTLAILITLANIGEPGVYIANTYNNPLQCHKDKAGVEQLLTSLDKGDRVSSWQVVCHEQKTGKMKL